MDSVRLGTNGPTTSRIGLGMATLMREPTPSARQKVLDAAYEMGVRHLDVAPAYGLGRAEAEVSLFLRRSGVTDVTVATKFGLRVGAKAKLLAPVQAPVRKVMVASPALRRLAKLAEISAGQPEARPPSELAPSLEQSLHELGLSKIDLLILHDAVWTPAWLEAWPGLAKLDGFGQLGASGGPSIINGYPGSVLDDLAVLQGPPTLISVGAQAIYHSAVGEFSRPVTAAIRQLANADLESLRELVGGGPIDALAVRTLGVFGLLETDPRSMVLIGTTNADHLRVIVERVEAMTRRAEVTHKEIVARVVERARHHLGGSKVRDDHE